MIVWLIECWFFCTFGGVMVSDSCSRGRRFDSQPFLFHVMKLSKLFTHMYLCHQAEQFGIGHRAVRWSEWCTFDTCQNCIWVKTLICVKKAGSIRRSVAGKVTSGLLLHWPYGTSQTRWHIQLPTYEFTLLNGLRHGNEPMLWKIWHLYLLLLPTIPHRQSPCGYVWSITQKYKWIPKCSNLV